jgi:hypothetical protein
MQEPPACPTVGHGHGHITDFDMCLIHYNFFLKEGKKDEKDCKN